MRISEAGRRAAYDLRARTARTVMSCLGVAVGVAAVVAVLGVAQTSTESLLNQLYALQDVLTVSGTSLAGGSGLLPRYTLATVGRLNPVESVSGTSQLTWTVRRSPLIPTGDTAGIGVMAVSGNLAQTTGSHLLFGRELGPNDLLPVTVLGYQAARLLGIDRHEVPCRVWMDNRWVVVTGVLAPSPLPDVVDLSALVGYPFARAQGGTAAAFATVYVRVRPGTAGAVTNILPATIEPLSPIDVIVNQPSAAVAAQVAARSALDGLFLALVGVGMVVAGLGVANTLTIAVVERRPEIGLRRALGATRSDIGAQFLAEGVLLAAGGAVGGAMAGTLAVFGYAWYSGLVPVFPLVGIGLGSGAALIVGVIAGFYPAAKATRLPPSDVLRMAP